MDWSFGYSGPSFSGQDLIGDAGSCRTCNRLASFHCKRCGDFYCSEKCQIDDWPNHRYICFPMPPLVRIRSPVHEDDIYPTKPPGIVENCVNEMSQTLKIALKKIEGLEDTIATMASKNVEVKATSTDTESSGSVANGSVTFPNGRNSFKDAESAACSSSRFGEMRTNGLQRTEASQLDRSCASPNNSETENNYASDDLVILCNFRSTNRCAIRPKDDETESAMRAIKERVDIFGRTAPKMEILPKIGSYAITQKSNKEYARVKITNVLNETKIRVLFCDYGPVICRKLNDLRVISQELTNLPEYITTFQLHGVHMTKYSDKIIEFLKSFERKVFKAKYIEEKGTTYVELYDVEKNELLNDMVKKFCSESDEPPTTSSAQNTPIPRPSSMRREIDTPTPEASAASGDGNAIERVMEPPFKTHTFNAEMRNIKAIIVDTDLVDFGYIACIQKADFPQLSKIQDVLNNMQYDDKPYQPKVNEYCVGKFEHDWYRGLVVSVLCDGTQFEISYIDFLNEALLESECIRPYPKDLKIDCYTTLCKIEGLPKNLTSEQRQFLRTEIKVNDAILIERVILIFEEKIALIECSDIINRMRSQNLL